jgi:arsenate reductase (thioredoxin)
MFVFRSGVRDGPIETESVVPVHRQLSAKPDGGRLLRQVAGSEFEALSAGVQPQALNPLAVEVMQEIGIDISHQRSKDVAEFLGQAIPYVITVCDHARERCPIFPLTYKFLHWSFDDPAQAEGSREEKLAVFRRVRDELRRRIDEELVASFLAGAQ